MSVFLKTRERECKNVFYFSFPCKFIFNFFIRMKDFLKDIAIVLEYVERHNKQDSEIEVAQAVADIEEFLTNNHLIPVKK